MYISRMHRCSPVALTVTFRIRANIIFMLKVYNFGYYM